MKRCRLNGWVASGALSVFFLWALPVRGYSQYSQAGDSTYCRMCHGDFRSGSYNSPSDGQNWGNLHNVHRFDMLNGDCDVCHGSNNFPVLIGSSTGGSGGMSAIGCMGCHGREADNNSGFPTDGRGAGLRQHHHNAGVNACVGCHQDADPANFTTAGENIPPEYYINPGTGHPDLPSNPCNPAGGEDFAGNAEGLDNDGDGVYDQSDPDCQGGGVCGDGNVDGGEACDDGNTTACDGCAADCSRADNVCGDGVTECGEGCDDGNTSSGDGCSATCEVEPGCGDGVLDAGEVCDDGNNVDCDGCAADCSRADAVCNDSIQECGETCDPSSSCPASCDDGNTCTADVMSGDPSTCDVACSNTPITACADDDGCCPAGCDFATDNDCSDSCGDGVIDPGETCDPPSTCPASCDDGDACTTDTLTGSAANCNVACSNTDITACVDGDGCCPGGCDETTDNNCGGSGLCGNGVIDPGETCDPPSSCPINCDDGDACTTDTRSGDAPNCDVTCANDPVVSCVDDDGCCPAGCDTNNDNDCTDSGSSDSGCNCRTGSLPVLPSVLVVFALVLLLSSRRKRKR